MRVLVKSSCPVKIHNPHPVSMPIKKRPTDYTEPDEQTWSINNTRTNHCYARIKNAERWESRIPPWSVNLQRIINRNAEIITVSRFNANNSLLDNNFLFISCYQITLRASPCAQFLNRIHNILFLIDKSIAKLCRPLEIIAHHS
ncbi:MAG: hypothetical protein BWY90_00773 [Deltaproteobacteria bacterium ADurb.BinA014]|nr:MAG: hypothetical protein BWY90_00773 [Deltaproteobacteria bacterium ADurb.BinA014]